jgi:hypothetical protein
MAQGELSQNDGLLVALRRQQKHIHNKSKTAHNLLATT